MMKEFLRAVAECRNEREFREVVTAAENRWTPRELMRVKQTARDLPPAIVGWLDYYATLVNSLAPHLRAFIRDDVRSNITRYSNPSVPRRKKRIVLSFAGFKGRAMVPTPVFLQMLPEDRMDLVLLHDETRTHFQNGLPPHASSLLELVTLLRKEVKIDEYERVYCYGASGGGFAALRAAVLLRAHRGIAASGRMQWHVNRLLNPEERAIPAFDPLCHCYAGCGVEMICAFGSENAQDRKDAEAVEQILPVRMMPVPGVAQHNFVWQLFQEGRAHGFFEEILDLDPIKNPAEQIASAARLSTQVGGFVRFGPRPTSARGPRRS
jgi:hypothetical protein